MPLFEATPVTIALPCYNDYFLYWTYYVYSLLKFEWLQKVLNIFGPENATFWGHFSYYSLFQL